MTIQGFIITLDRAVERRPQVDRLRQLCPVRCEAIQAVDGRLLSEAQRREVVRECIHRPRYPFRLRDGEVGIFLSHRKAWSEIVAQDLEAGLILEDDVELEPNVFRPGLDLALSDLKPMDVIKFPVSRANWFASRRKARPRSRAPIVTPLGATSLLVGHAAAKRLLELTERFDRPIDTFMQMTWITGIRPRVITPSGVTEISSRLGGSTIHAKKRPLLETLSRSVLRPVYRLQVNAVSHAWELRRRVGANAPTTRAG
ncbi:MAG: glycosyltransferase family 25 protein [Pirellulaceae bacterium]|nr:glycosyltransferase family 25 protein [Pirellulaceae bacterium]